MRGGEGERVAAPQVRTHLASSASGQEKSTDRSWSQALEEARVAVLRAPVHGAAPRLRLSPCGLGVCRHRPLCPQPPAPATHVAGWRRLLPGLSPQGGACAAGAWGSGLDIPITIVLATQLTVMAHGARGQHNAHALQPRFPAVPGMALVVRLPGRVAASLQADLLARVDTQCLGCPRQPVLRP